MNSDSMYNDLLQKAYQARTKAYCRYSSFAVGAALLTESGEIYTGCNIENASYSLCICAERVAFGKAVSDGHRHFQAIAIVGGATQEQHPEKPCMPCGACRQFLSEFCQGDFKIILSDRIYTLQELFPAGFSLS